MAILRKLRWTFYGRRVRINALISELEHIDVTRRLARETRDSTGKTRPSVVASGKAIQ